MAENGAPLFEDASLASRVDSKLREALVQVQVQSLHVDAYKVDKVTFHGIPEDQDEEHYPMSEDNFSDDNSVARMSSDTGFPSPRFNSNDEENDEEKADNENADAGPDQVHLVLPSLLKSTTLFLRSCSCF